MRHRIGRAGNLLTDVEYAWFAGDEWTTLRARVQGEPRALTEGSLEEFITEHYWGYTRQRDGGTVEYRVEHPSWRVWTATAASLNGNASSVYGNDLAAILAEPPHSAFVADGSAVTVYSPSRIARAST